MLHPDDNLHPAGHDEAFFEAWWFGFQVPDRLISVYAYPWFRPNLGIAGGGVLAWDGRGSLPWTMLHNDYAWSRVTRDPAVMMRGDEADTPQGIRINCLAPAERYRVRYERPALAFDVTFEATGPASSTSATAAEQDIFKGHVDQPGHYRGRLRIGDEWLEVDCHGVRDRSWGPRRDDATTMHVGYYHATASDRDAFLIVTHADADDDGSSLISGYLIRDGEQAPLVTGGARVTRNGDLSPASCVIEAVDAKGRKLTASGTSRNYAAIQLQPGMFNWSSLAEWRFDDVTCFGELQDTWHPDRYRAFARARGGL